MMCKFLQVKTGSVSSRRFAALVWGVVMSLGNYAEAGEYHVSKTGSDKNDGTKKLPLLTISEAAKRAKPSDTVIVHEGIYREWVRPARGGSSEDARITYKAAEGEHVVISGSERVTGWEKEEKSSLWKVVLSKRFFDDYNPFAKLMRHDSYIEADESSHGWGWLNYGRRKHRGDVYFNGEGFVEQERLEDLTKYGNWYVDVSPEERYTTIWAHFGDEDPNKAGVEVNVRPSLFYPEESGLSYITLQGFTLKNSAVSWMPPTSDQIGAVGPNGGHHWKILDNNIMYSKGVCISLGQPTGEASLKESGHHIVRNNIIQRCNQAGIAGEQWASYSEIKNNIIEDTNYRLEYGGAETAAIKFHRSKYVVVEGNFIRGVYRANDNHGSAAHGIWVDFRDEHWIISKNVIMDTDAAAILLEANWDGYFLIEKNIIIDGMLFTMSSKNDVWAHNLFIDSHGAWVNQKYGGRPKVSDSRWFNNLFVGGGLDQAPNESSYNIDYNIYLKGAKKSHLDKNSFGDNYDPEVKYSFSDQEMLLNFKWKEEFSLQDSPLVTTEYVKMPIMQPNGENVNQVHLEFGS